MDNPELNCKWHFAEQLGGREDGPNDPMQDNFKKAPYASLIREAIQNSLDVVLNENEPVRVDFSIRKISLNQYPNFFELKKHIEGCISYYKNNNDAKNTYEPMLEYLDSFGKYDNFYYIKVSDYNTRGMNYMKGDTSQPFYAFVRSAGVSSKNDATAGGSFGFGKAAYFYISPIRTIFVSTCTNKGRCFFEGVSSLCTHQLEGNNKRYVSVGYYDNNNGEPVTKIDDIPQKFQRQEAGTDICILGINGSDRDSITKEMTEAVLRNFWLAIEQKKLVVTVRDTEINFETMPALMDNFFPEENDTARREYNYNPRPYWESVHNANIDKNHIVIEDTLPTLGHVTFYALKKKNVTDKILYMRRLLMLVKARRTQSSNGFYGVFVCDDKYGNELLRKTENPAHNEWKSANWREDGRVVDKGRAAIEDIEKFIINVTEQLFANRSSAVQQIKGLEDFLYIPTAVEDDDDYENESLIGDVVGSKDEEGNSLSTELNNPIQNLNDDKLAIGKVMITEDLESSLAKNKEGGILSGHGTMKKKKRGGGGLSPKRIEGHFEQLEDGIQGTTLSEIPVRYRSFAYSKDGKTRHVIIIHSNYEVVNGRIDLTIGGDQTDDIVAIKDCDPKCKIEGNSLSGLQINKGKNMLEVVFADNMKHAVKLDAYEYK